MFYPQNKTAEQKSRKINQEVQQSFTCVLKQASNFHELCESPEKFCYEQN